MFVYFICKVNEVKLFSLLCVCVSVCLVSVHSATQQHQTLNI